MANVMFKIGMNNTVKPGQQTRDEVIARLIAQGVAVQAANPVFDPITGELIQTEVHLPDTASQQAIDAISANSGVATSTPPIPEPPASAVVGIDATAGLYEYGAAITWPTVNPTVANIFVWHTTPTVVGGIPAGYFLGESTYVSQASSNFNPTLFSQVGLSIEMSPFGTGNLVIPANTLGIKAGDATEYDLTHPQITMTAGEVSILKFFVLNNKLYLAFTRDNGVVTLPDMSLEQAIAYPSNPVSSAILV